MQTIQYPAGGIHDAFPRHGVATPDFKYLTLSHLNKYTRFIQSYAYSPVNTPGSAMHIDECKVQPRGCLDNHPPFVEKPVIGKLLFDKDQRFTLMDDPVLPD